MRARHKECSGLDIDDGGRGDTDFGPNERTLHHVFGERDRAARLVEEADLPEWRIAGTSGVEGEDAVVLGGDEENVVRAFAGNFNGGNEQRLGIDRAVDFERA